MYLLIMRIFSSSPYATFNSKEWNSFISKSDKYENTPIKIQKRYFKTFNIKNIQKTNLLPEKKESHKQMQLIFA